MEIKSIEIDSKFELVYNLLDGMLVDYGLNISEAFMVDSNLQSKRRIKYLFNNISELAFIIDEKGKILFTNSQVMLEFGDIPLSSASVDTILSKGSASEFKKFPQIHADVIADMKQFVHQNGADSVVWRALSIETIVQQ